MKLERGINLGGYLSQCVHSTEHYDAFIQEEDIRKIAPNHFLLVPGVGAQGGSLEEVCKYGMNSTCGLIVNSSRGIIYVDKTEKFAEAARLAAQEVQAQMAEQLKAIL